MHFKENILPHINSFNVLSDLAPFFTLATDGPTVRISLSGTIPEDIIPPNRIIILVLRASEPQALPAFATIVLAVERIPGPPPIEPPVFADTYYTGHYTEQAGLSFDQLITLNSGSDTAIVFALDGGMVLHLPITSFKYRRYKVWNKHDETFLCF